MILIFFEKIYSIKSSLIVILLLLAVFGLGSHLAEKISRIDGLLLSQPNRAYASSACESYNPSKDECEGGCVDWKTCQVDDEGTCQSKCGCGLCHPKDCSNQSDCPGESFCNLNGGKCGSCEGAGSNPGANGCSYVPDEPLGCDFESACDNHDECYQECGNEKDSCDSQFEDDLEEAADGYVGCEVIADGYSSGVGIAGGPAYNSTQKNDCC